MSNRRRPQRRDHHGAPMRSRQEITIAVATALGVLGGTVGLLFLIDRLEREDSVGVVTPPVTQPAVQSSSSTSTTKPTGSSSSTSASSTSSATRAPSTSSGSAGSTTSSRPPSSSTTRP